jgi:hypothetical protein
MTPYQSGTGFLAAICRNPQETVTVASKLLVLLIDLRPRNGIISMINKKSKFIELRF